MSDVRIGFSSNGVEVFGMNGVDGTHWHEYTPETHMGLLKDVIGMLNVKYPETGRKTVFGHFDMGGVVGEDHLVKTDDSDVIVYWHRSPDRPASRMVVARKEDGELVEREPEPTSEINVVVGNVPGTDKNYIYTIYAGSCGEREVGDKSLVTDEQKAVAAAFWANHALVPTVEERMQMKKDGVIA